MQSALILFATKEGQTAKIAARIEKHLRGRGLATTLVNAFDLESTRQLDLSRYDLLVCGASMHVGGLEREILAFIKDNQDQIAEMKRSFFLVSLSAATKDPDLRGESLHEARNKTQAQLAVAFDDIEMVAGALPYSKYPWPLKWLMKRIAAQAGEVTDTSRDYEYTDWDQVEQYAERLCERLVPRLL